MYHLISTRSPDIQFLHSLLFLLMHVKSESNENPNAAKVTDWYQLAKQRTRVYLVSLVLTAVLGGLIIGSMIFQL